MAISRRQFTVSMGLGICSALLVKAPAIGGLARPKVVVIGGGAGGATTARSLFYTYGDKLDITLIEPNPIYETCFFSNSFLGGMIDHDHLLYDYSLIKSETKIRVIPTRADRIDSARKQVVLTDGARVDYDRCFVSPGIDFYEEGDDKALAGWSLSVADRLPHAWRSGDQIANLKSQILNMPKGGTFAIVVPDSPYRCPPAPYERAAMVGHYLKQHNPTAKILILDKKNSFPLMDVMVPAWDRFYGSMIEWLPGNFGGDIESVDAQSMTLKSSDGDEYNVDVANIIPPQKAGEIAIKSGLADESGWCPIDLLTGKSTLADDIHVIGDAAAAHPMPKSGHIAVSQGKNYGEIAAAELLGEEPPITDLRNSCYFLVKPDYGMRIEGHYRQGDDNKLHVLKSGAGDDRDDDLARAEIANKAGGWFAAMTGTMFGQRKSNTEQNKGAKR